MAAGSFVLWSIVELFEADLELWKNWWVNLEGEQESEQICSVL